MTRRQFAHTVRAAGAILGADKILVVGSQAVHASVDKLFPAASRSIEADISALQDPDGSKADLIDGSIGELSIFQQTYGYYAQGVTLNTAILPDGWRERLVPFSSPETNGVTAYCLELHDLWLSKAAVGRPKDLEFCAELAKRKYVRAKLLEDRLNTMKDLPAAKAAFIKSLIAAI